LKWVGINIPYIEKFDVKIIVPEGIVVKPDLAWDCAICLIWREEAINGDDWDASELNEYFGENWGRTRFFGAITGRLGRNKSGKRSEQTGISEPGTN
jgi:hypothetical protein